MDYKQRLQNITTLEELYSFREELKKDADTNGLKESSERSFEEIANCQEANWYIDRVNTRIKHLESNGVFLDKIELPGKDEDPEPDEDVKKRFLSCLHGYVDEIAQYKDKTEPEKLSLLAFCMLVMLDGEAVGIPPFAVRPVDEKGNEGGDIAGNLHDEWHKL